MKVLVTGATGLIGSALCQALAASGQQVGRLRRVRTPDGEPFWDIENGIVDLGAFGPPEAVVHLAGESIAQGRWTADKKARIERSRSVGTKLLAQFLAGLQPKPRVLISASAVGIYGNRGAELLNEDSELGEGFLVGVARQWEAAALPAAKAGIRVVNARNGIVLSRTGGILKRMLFPFQVGLGARLGDGRQYLAWIGITDMVAGIRFLLDHDEISGPVNLASPNPATNREFTRAMGRALRRPAALWLPAWALRLAFGQVADEMLLASLRVVPKRLLDAGFKFGQPDLEPALREALRPDQ